MNLFAGLCGSNSELNFNIGIKHNVPFSDVARGCQHSPRDLANVNDRYYCINSAQTNEIIALYILQSHHIFIRRVKAFILCSFRADFSFSLSARDLSGAR